MVAKRLSGIGEYYFSQKLREIDELNKSGKNIINLGIGSPDLPPHPEVINVLREESQKPNVHAYQGYKGAAVLRKAISEWYEKWYRVQLNPETEILPLIGSKEGIMHISMTYLDPADVVFVPNPGYPTYRSAGLLAGGTVVEYHLNEENDWCPNLNELENLLTPSARGAGIERTALMWLNYPQMPTGKLPTMELFQNIVEFAKKHNILVCHDNPYSFILNERPMSILEVDGAKEVAIELNSLSKCQNMAGWRVGMMVGAQERVQEVLRFKSNMDSGMFLPVQLAAAKALSLGKEWYEEINAVYRKRRKKVFEMLKMLNCKIDLNQAGLFVWAKIPIQYNSGVELSDEILYKANVFITPGIIFGSEGDQYVRVSICTGEENIEKAIQRIKNK